MKSAVRHFVSAAVVALSASAAMAQAKAPPAEPKFEKAKEFYSQCTGATSDEFAKIQAQLVAFTDAEVMAETLNDPEKLAALTVIVNDPHAIHVMANCALEPVMWNTWIQNGTDYKKMSSAMVKMMNPVGMMKWMMAPMNPKIWEAAAAHANPDKYTKWGTAVANPAFYKPVTAMTEAQWYETRFKWVADSSTYTPFVNMVTAMIPGKSEPAAAAKPAK